jgi:hypothetical protein
MKSEMQTVATTGQPSTPVHIPSAISSGSERR